MAPQTAARLAGAALAAALGTAAAAAQVVIDMPAPRAAAGAATVAPGAAALERYASARTAPQAASVRLPAYPFGYFGRAWGYGYPLAYPWGYPLPVFGHVHVHHGFHHDGAGMRHAGRARSGVTPAAGGGSEAASPSR